MTIYVPWGIIPLFISIYLFREYNRVRQAKRDQRSESLADIRQKYLDSLIRSKKEKAGDKENPAQ